MKECYDFWYDNLVEKHNLLDTNSDKKILGSVGAMHIAVCDDDKIYLDLFLNYIKDYLAMLENSCDGVVLDCYTTGEELVEAYKTGKAYDLIYLDIKMKKISGFDAAKIIRNYDSKALIIFITSLKDYIFNSFEYQPFWFLIKPVYREKFGHVLKQAIAKINEIKNKRYSFYTRDHGLMSLEIDRIMYLESILRKIILYTSNHQFTYYANLKEEEAKLTKYNFIRIHKGYLVNMEYIQRINKSNIVLKNNMVLPLSEHRLKVVFDSFTSFLARC
ncbi:MAG: response regulator [Clostridiaceae bacterium]|nr:response regulator [Clostridiaceae bacterium]